MNRVEEIKIQVKERARTWVLNHLCLERSGAHLEPLPWMTQQIKSDLAPFLTSGAAKEKLDRIWNQQMASGWPLFRVTIKNNQLSLISNNHRNLRLSYLRSGFRALLNWIKVPDVDFLIVAQDSLNGVEPEIPLFTFSNNPKLSTNMVLMPDFEVLSGRNWKYLRQIYRANRKYPWPNRREQCVWRGGISKDCYLSSGFEKMVRTKAVTLSLENPLLLNAKFVASDSIPNHHETYAQYPSYFGNQITIEDHLEYKYQLLIDGNSSSYSRAYWQLFSNSLIFKQQSDFIQWYWSDLKPYVHYIPVKEDLSDLISSIEWARDNDTEALQIALNARAFGDQNLSFTKVFQYFYLLLEQYSRLPGQSQGAQNH